MTGVEAVAWAMLLALVLYGLRIVAHRAIDRMSRDWVNDLRRRHGPGADD